MINRCKSVTLLIVFGIGFFPAFADSDYPVTIIGGDGKSFRPQQHEPAVVVDEPAVDVVVVGAGPGGLTASVYLSDLKKSVLVLEKEPVVGGLAAGSQIDGIRYGRGGSYWTETYPEEQKIFEHLGLGDYKKQYGIVEPTDSYLWNGKFYPGVWEKGTLKLLPTSFIVFKHMLELADEDGLIPDQPLEDAENLILDTMTAADWIRKMPSELSQRQDQKSKAIRQKFLSDKTIHSADPMSDVIHFLDLYCRSALGGNASDISAIALANFYVSEIKLATLVLLERGFWPNEWSKF